MTKSTEKKSHELLQIIREDGLRDRTLEPQLSETQLKEIYRAMLLIRVLDQRMLNLQRQGRVGFYGTVTGEEAAVIGSAYALKKEDWILPALRQGGAALMRGFPLSLYIAQCIGNSLDVQKGRQMPCHYGYKPANFVCWSSNIATQLPHAVGVAYAAKIKKDPIVVMGYLGDGATSEGDFHVAMNFAGVWKVPAVFVCQNNQWAISVPLSMQTASETIAMKANAYGFQGVRVDGNDVLAVYKASQQAVDRARAGEGPTLIEAVTYRIGAHSSSDDPTRYRSEEEVEKWRQRDPLDRYKHYLKQRAIWTPAFENQLQDELNTQITQAIAEAEAAPPLTIDSLFADVYKEMPWHLREQLDTLKQTP